MDAVWTALLLGVVAYVSHKAYRMLYRAVPQCVRATYDDL